MSETHSRPVTGGRGVWYTERLWALSSDLPVIEVAIADIPEFDMNCWFRPQTPPTVRAVAEHARRIFDADLSYPVILTANGELMDGGHRIAKAWLEGRTTVAARRFEVNPKPDYMIPDES